MAAISIKNVATLSMAFCRDNGLMKDNSTVVSTLTVNRGQRSLLDITVTFDMVNNYSVRFEYDLNGIRYDYTVRLRYCTSNLNRGGYYYFVCPVTGASCRKLYFVNNRFVGRKAFNAIYPVQTLSRKQRTSGPAFLLLSNTAERLINQPYRKETYRGKLTPYGRKLQRLNDKLGRVQQGIKDDIAQLIRETPELWPI